MSRILKDAEIAFLRTCREACDAALESAAPKIEKDFKAKVFGQAVDDYYSDYKPSRYKRTGSLHNAFRAKSTIAGDSISVKGAWDFNWLPDYHSGSKYHKSGDEWISRYDIDDDGNEIFDWDSDSNGVPEKGWIFKNLMEGVHPRFITRFGLVFDESYHYEPTWKRIKRYLNDYKDSDDLKDILTKELKKQCKKMM